MTKSDIVNIIKQKLQGEMVDTGGLKEDIDYYFAQWFQGLVDQGMQYINPAPQQAAQESGGE